MGLAGLIARRSVLRRPGRTIFTVLGVALGVATVVGVTTLDHATIHGYARPRQAVDRPDVEVVGDGVAAAPEAIADLEGISVAARFFENEVELEAGPRTDDGAAEVSLRARVFAVDAGAAPALGAFGVERGADLSPRGGAVPDVLVGPGLAGEHGIDVGDEVLMSRPARTARKRCEDGVLVEVEPGEEGPPRVQRFRVTGVLTREGVGRSARGMVVVVDYDVAMDLFRGVDVRPRVWAKKDPGVDLERLQRSLSSSYSYALNKGVVVGQAADERAFRTGIRMLGLLALVLGLYVIFHTLSMSLRERVLEVGTLHALGSSRRQIGRVFLTEAALLSGAGAVLGAAGGVALAWAATRFGVTTLGVNKWVVAFHVPWATVLALTAIGAAVALVGSVFPLVAIGGADTLAALRGDDATGGRARGQAGFRIAFAVLLALVVPALYLLAVPVVGQLSRELLATLLGVVGVLAAVVLLSLFVPAALSLVCRAVAGPLIALFPFAGRLASRAMQDGPARIGVSVSAIALVAAGFVGLHGMTASLRGEVTAWAEEAVDDRVYVRGLAATPFDDLADHLMQYPGVLGVEKGSARIYTPFLVLGADGERMSGYGPFADDPSLLERFAAERTVILSRRLARDLEYETGDVVRMKDRDGDEVAFEVLTVSDAYGYWTAPDERLYGLISDRWMEKDFCIASDTVDEVAVRFDGSAAMTEGGHLGVLRAALRDVQPGNERLDVRPGWAVRDYALLDIGRDFFVFDMLLALMAGLAGLGVLNGMLLATLERTRELGVLKALGASRGQVGGAMLLEAAVVGAVGGALGVALGAGATPFVVTALETLAGLDLPARSAGAWIPLTFAGAVVLSVVSALYPIRRAHTADAVRAVRTR